MICITGDVHQASFDNEEQSYLEKSELRTALEYQDVVERYGLRNTLFLTGKAVDEEPAVARRLATSPGLEVGGHTWAAFRPRFLHRVFGALGHTYGPRWFQAWDVRRTRRRISDVTGSPVVSWRTHAYLSNTDTRHVLRNQGVELVSDTVTPREQGPSTDETGLTSLPINTLPDHEHVFHGPRSTDDVAEDWSDEFTAESFEVEEWVERVKSQIRAIECDDGVATVLAHPSCMAIADCFAAFERLCAWIDAEGFETGRCADVLENR